MGFSYDFPKDDKKIKIDVKMRDEDYEKLKEERDTLRSALDVAALNEFERQKNELLKMASAEDKDIIQNLENPSELEFWKGVYATKRHYTPESSGQASMRDRSSSSGLREEFSSGEEMVRYYFQIAQERQNNMLTERAKLARERLEQLKDKFKLPDHAWKFEIPTTPILRNPQKREEVWPHVTTKEEGRKRGDRAIRKGEP